MNRRDIIKLAVLALVLVLSVSVVNRIAGAHARAETDLVRDAVRNAAVTCYAVEGAYPVDEINEDGYPVPGTALQYLREHYHLAYDEEQYFVTYESFAYNVFPTIFVTERGATLP